MTPLPKVPSNTGRVKQPIHDSPGILDPRRHSRETLALELGDHVQVVNGAEPVHRHLIIRFVQRGVVLAVAKAQGARLAVDKVPEAAAVDVEVLGLGDALVQAHAALRCVDQ